MTHLKHNWFVPSSCHITGVLAALLLCSSVFAEEIPELGKKIYLNKCSDCHGAKGEGVEGAYAQPLIGDSSIRELTQYISEEMPEGEPKECVAEDAAAVSIYIYNEFYSPVAQVRNKPPRIELSRLTVRQYRNSVADLFGNFLWRQRLDGEQGLQGNYYRSRKQNDENRVAQRVDARIDIDLDAKQPFPDAEFEEQYPFVWTGALWAPKTGWYDLIVDSENGFEFWLNGGDRPLIDGRVKSGDETSHTAQAYLLEGRVYPVRLQLNKKKTDERVTMALRWKPPHAPEEPIPAHAMTPKNFPTCLTVSADFPPDDRSVGYERGVQVSQEWFDATTAAAVEVVDQLMPHLKSMTKTDRMQEIKPEALKQLCVDVATFAFRRPLNDAMKQLYVETHFIQNDDPQLATKRSLLMILQSPRFLFPDANTSESFDDYDLGAWLALTLWDSMPDRRMLELAEKREWSDRNKIEQEARRMLRDDRTEAKVRKFFHQWLYFDRFTELSKAQDRHPDFNDELVSDLRSSVDLFIDQAFWSDNSNYRDLLMTDHIFASKRLADFYGLPHSGGPKFEWVKFPEGQRSGVLTHPYLLAGLSYQDTTSPIHRGVFLSRSLLGRFLKSPPIAVAPTPADLAPELTTRERVVEQTKDTNCLACHRLINYLGFSLENYDEVGRFRSLERDRPIDASGYYIDRDGNKFDFAGSGELAEFLISSEDARQAFVEQLFQYTTKQPIQAYGPKMLPELTKRFEASNHNMQKLLVDIVTETALYYRQSRQQVAVNK